jgi:hypothetical protein
VFDTSEKEEFEEKERYNYFLSGRKGTRKKMGRTPPISGSGNEVSNHLAPKTILKRRGITHSPTPIREEKVKEARRKKQRGDYYNEEVYQKIADRLMDLFGVK